MTWSDVAVAGAFVLGLGVGTVVSIRVMRNVMEYVGKQGKQGKE